jgi:NADH-quinone oxidoreductase subunit D
MSTPPVSPFGFGGPTVRAVNDPFHGDLLEVSMGPQHPSTHGVFRMVVTLDGEIIVKLKPVFGYLHRNHEKIAENTTYLNTMPYTDRLDYLCSLSTNWGYALAVEKLAGLSVPDRAQYLRIILAEMTRLVNHTCLVGFLFNDLGTSFTPLLYGFREREKFLDLFEALTGSRMMCNYARFGGCRIDPTPEWLAAASKLVAGYPRFLDEWETMLTANEIMLARTQGVGRLDLNHAINAGITGPCLRASGGTYDVRKVDGYGFYPRFDFRVPVGEHGDTYDRYMLRILEMRESVKILEQAFRDLPAGPIMDPKAKLRGFRPKAGEAYGRIESPKGELGFYLLSDGTPNPYRYRVRPPTLINLTLLEEMCLGHTVADAVVILGSIDIVLGEVDR